MLEVFGCKGLRAEDLGHCLLLGAALGKHYSLDLSRESSGEIGFGLLKQSFFFPIRFGVNNFFGIVLVSQKAFGVLRVQPIFVVQINFTYSLACFLEFVILYPRVFCALTCLDLMCLPSTKSMSFCTSFGLWR
jgi:hypothetical protein